MCHCFPLILALVRRCVALYFAQIHVSAGNTHAESASSGTARCCLAFTHPWLVCTVLAGVHTPGRCAHPCFLCYSCACCGIPALLVVFLINNKSGALGRHQNGTHSSLGAGWGACATRCCLAFTRPWLVCTVLAGVHTPGRCAHPWPVCTPLAGVHTPAACAIPVLAAVFLRFLWYS